MKKSPFSSFVQKHPHWGLFLIGAPLLFVFLGLLLLVQNEVALKQIEATLFPSKVLAKSQEGKIRSALSEAQQLDQISYLNHLDSFVPSYAFEDKFKRISPAFRVPKSLKARTQFWFDVYTHYDKNKHVIHHTRYPWIIFEVVDTTRFLNGKKPLWLEQKKANQFVSLRKKKIRAALDRLIRRKNYRRMDRDERLVYKKLSLLKGNRKTVFRVARKHVRSQRGQRDYFVSGLLAANQYLPAIEEVFANKNLPIELTRIPFVESSFNTKAQSKVGASGIWQIMPYIGKKLSIVNNYIDERNSPIKASKVAARVLKENFQILKSWPLAVTAYNNGAGNIRKAMRKARSKDLAQIISRYHDGQFRFASANFYTSFLAALHAQVYSKELFFNELDSLPEPYVKHALRLNRKMKPKMIANLAGMTLDDLKNYNLDLKKAIKKNIYLPIGYKILLPPENYEIFRSNLGRSSTRRDSIDKKAVL